MKNKVPETLAPPLTAQALRRQVESRDESEQQDVVRFVDFVDSLDTDPRLRKTREDFLAALKANSL